MPTCPQAKEDKWERHGVVGELRHLVDDPAVGIAGISAEMLRRDLLRQRTQQEPVTPGRPTLHEGCGVGPVDSAGMSPSTPIGQVY